LASLDPRSKLLLAVGFILTLSLLPPGNFILYLLLLLILYAAVLLSREDIIFLLKRSVIALPFALAAATLLFTVPGKTLATLPGVNIGITVEGFVRFTSIVLKSWISVQAAVLLVKLTEISDLMWALQSFRVPPILISVANFSYRYLDVLRSEGARLRTARDSRSAVLPGKKPGGGLLWRARVTGWMVGSLMIRSMERSERIYSAMLARGFTGRIKTLKHFRMNILDYGTLTVGAILYIGVLSASLVS
jgi:cobalt/nickel transport system permease protein